MTEPNIIVSDDNYYWDRLPDATITRKRPHSEHDDIILQFAEVDGKETIKGIVYPKRYTMEQVKAMAAKHEPEIAAGKCVACGEEQSQVIYRDLFPIFERPSIVDGLRNRVRSRLESRLR